MRISWTQDMPRAKVRFKNKESTWKPNFLYCRWKDRTIYEEIVVEMHEDYIDCCTGYEVDPDSKRCIGLF